MIMKHITLPGLLILCSLTFAIAFFHGEVPTTEEERNSRLESFKYLAGMTRPLFKVTIVLLGSVLFVFIFFLFISGAYTRL